MGLILMAYDITQLKLGSDSAEKDIEVGLLRYFLKSKSYEKLSAGQKTIVVGNRGVGKSAIFKYIATNERENGHIVLELTPEEYSYEVLSSTLRKESEGSWGKDAAFSTAWQYLLYNLIFKEIVRRNKTNVPKRIFQYVRDNLKIDGLNPISLMVSYLKRLEGIKVGSYEGTIKVKELQSLYALEEIKDLSEDLKAYLSRNRTLIFIDELDKGWDNLEDSRFFVSGLIQAAQKMNRISPNLKIYVSIRQEIFDNIPQIYDDAQKIREDIEIIRWSDVDLLDFIGLRITDSFPDTSGLDPLAKWNLFFAEVLDYRQTKSFNYLIDRTQLRPREFLQFCKACIEALPNGKDVVQYNDITSAEREYSEQKTKDLASEYRFQFPSLLDIFELFRGRVYTFENEELDYFLLDLIENKNVGNAQWVRTIEYLDLKKILWQIGFLKAHVVGGLKFGRKTGSSYLGIYEAPQLNLENVPRFQVHHAFRAYLNLKEK